MRQTRLPDYHFMFIAPSLGAEWFFDAARDYWNRFRPTVVSGFELISFVPEDASVIVTVIARRDIVDILGVEMAQVIPRALFDPVAFDLFEEMKAALNQRAILNQPFGVPLEPTALPGEEIELTPGSILNPPTRAPGGFITQTPTPTQPAPVPTQAPDAAQPIVPTIQPTPGSILGG